ncbi:hypothetical protein ACQY0O_004207 [Thecaphora frezii]
MGALGIPTSRALAVVSLPDLKVLRERINPAAITTRLCPSWLRIGSFQIHSSRSEWESCRILGEYVAHDLFGWRDVVKGGPASASTSGSGSGSGDATAPRRPAWARRLVEEVAKRNARTIAQWQVYGFMHGVMNTDNIALLGHTIDYGPYAFMDLFDEGQICNHSDGEGRYAYRLQPTMGVFAIRELVDALAPLIGFEVRFGRAPAPGEMGQLKSEEVDELVEVAKKEAKDEVETLFTSTLVEEWKRGWSKRLGLRDAAAPSAGGGGLIEPLLVALADLDFSSTLRGLCQLPAFLKERGLGVDGAEFDEGELKRALDEFLSIQQEGGNGSVMYDATVLMPFLRSAKREQWKAWLVDYARRLLEEARDGDEVTREMKKVNPRFVLRNWVTQEVVERVERENDTERLRRVLEMCLHPFEEWGVPREGKSDEEVKEEACVEASLCIM